jgi:hypothetical protein
MTGLFFLLLRKIGPISKQSVATIEILVFHWKKHAGKRGENF